MPYLKEEDKERLLANIPATEPGGLNFLLTSVCLEYWDFSSKNYQAINDIIGALESCKLEFYRRLAVPYENEKIIVNGDVYEEATK